MTALAIASSVADFAGKAAQASAENDARAANRAYAREDYNRQLVEEQRNFVAESRATQQKSFDEELKTRAAIGKSRAEAATQGAAGVSVNGVLNELIGIGARTQGRLDDEQNLHAINYRNKVDSAYTTARSRINGNQPVSGPNPIGLAINIGSRIYEG